MDNRLYDYSPIVGREPIRWPGGARVAFYVGLNIEHYRIDRPSTSTFEGTRDLAPDPLNYGWRDYGPRVGVWRQIESLDRHGMRASVLLNSDAGERYPEIVEAGRARNWAWLAHGKNNSTFQADMSVEEERAYLTEVIGSIEKTTGQRPRGWMGPALTETFETPRLLAELGLDYVLDWTSDDQPYRLNVPGMLSVPYSVELNDIGLFVSKGLTGPDFVRIVKDQLDRLYEDSADSGRVMALALHPFVTGQPFRAKYLDQALEYVADHPGVWLTTSDEIADHYARTTASGPGGASSEDAS
ncbi:polysaccharide deacetylase family protein [Streptomyces huiliensis]|uniref:polysaccharide deacetylase family protein n=1 Tax=Streptomyces huiliensis TaxID=2876027 RepID=UPI001CBAD64D|nr:polysaccharide deacetylase family protein [Streptomyces huiliensis]MBZ4320434.1 polysaccharide deacetylase family protein [Streptomyces huiliensis]